MGEGIILSLTELALRRAGVGDLQEFQRQRGLYPSGREDMLTMQQLMPYLLGYRRYMVKPGDTYYSIARQFSTTIRAISTANPTVDPRRLRALWLLGGSYGCALHLGAVGSLYRGADYALSLPQQQILRKNCLRTVDPSAEDGGGTPLCSV